jgi:hypothetical protein
MREELIVQEEKPSTIKKIIVGIIIGLVIIGTIVAGIALQISQRLSSSNSPYVEVDYKTFGWFYGYNNNYTYLVLNVSIINHGYSQVNVQSISLSGGFSVTINNAVFPQIYVAAVKTLETYTLITTTLSDVILLNTGETSGTIIFQFNASPKIYQEPFALSYVVTCGTNYQTATVRIVSFDSFGGT